MGYERAIVHADDKDMVTVFVHGAIAVQLRFQRHDDEISSTLILLGRTSCVSDVPSVVIYDKLIQRPTVVRSRRAIG